MPKPNLFGSGFRGAHSRCLILIAALFFTPLTRINAQEHEEDHDQDHLHFSHPLVTESPSPDTKFRLDYIRARTSDPIEISENTFRLEGEYSFNHGVSLAIVTPFISRTAPAAERARGLGNIELSLKAASLAFGERGLLLGGGLSAALPTGSDAKGIGSAHIVELEPFLDAGYKRDAFELVGFAILSSTLHRRASEEAERNLTFNFSTLYKIQSRFEGMIEVTTKRALIGPESGSQQTFIAPGFKVYPLTNRNLMFGASVELGTGVVHDTHALLLSAFYHF
ncbi:MAG TPA: hypothetical protein VGQ98_08620 [Gemmatimonadaceae bacterium]|nr:hypothetical protein [Gemmatimonadaceae bacterium]